MAEPHLPPSSNHELMALDATDQAELIRRGSVSPTELVEAAIRRVEQVNPLLNAVISPLFEQARHAVSPDVPHGPLASVPFVLKDLGAVQRGQPYYAGNIALKSAGLLASRDSPLGERFRSAGLVTIGKTNTPEMGAQTTTQPLAFGPTHNPWDLSRSPGGSSGGSCAAVAAHLVPIAHANDGSGSIRIPASWCGLVGLKPSRGRVPSEPTNISRLGVEFVVTRTVRDTAAALDAVHGHTTGQLYPLRAPTRSYRQELGAPVGSLRIGVLASAGPITLHRACKAATEETATLLDSLGHSVSSSFPIALLDASDEKLKKDNLLRRGAYRARCHAVQTLLGRKLTAADVEPYLWSMAEWERELPVEHYLAAAAWQQGWATRVTSWWAEGWDLLLTPTVHEPAVRLEEMVPPLDMPSRLAEKVKSHCFFTQPFNITGQPAITLPLCLTDDGMPVGVQLVADLGREDLLLRVAYQLEQAKPWAHRRPSLSVPPTGGVLPGPAKSQRG